MRESTKLLLQKHGWRIDRAIHNYLYFLFYFPYVAIVYYALSFLSKTLFWFKPFNPVLNMALNRYHCKVLSGKNVRRILTLNEDLSAISEKNKQIIPFKYAYKIIFKNADYIAVMDCPCKKTLNAPADTINSCLCVGKGTAYFWIDRCAKKYHARKISQDEALEIVKGFRARGYVTQAFFKVATGGCTGVICNCHPDTCVALRANAMVRRFNEKFRMSVESGYSVAHREDRCKQCGTCADFCHFGGITVVRGESWVYNRENCVGCGLCEEHCPEQALRLYQDPGKVFPLDIELVKSDFM